MEDEAEAITDRDNALFEAGIKLGALYHQFIGTPVSTETAESLENAIAQSVSLQPWVSTVTAKINRDKVRARANEFGYCELRGDMLDVTVVIQYKAVEARVRVKYDKARDYPLMRIEAVSRLDR
ncbi:MAG: dihydroneopterin aldolase family protein [Candidatus Methanospirareceae archaeon]